MGFRVHPSLRILRPHAAVTFCGYNAAMDRKPAPDEWKAIAFFAMAAIGAIAGMGAIIEMTWWSPGPFAVAFVTIVSLRLIYSGVSMFSRWSDPRNAKRPPESD